jgi:transposase
VAAQRKYPLELRERALRLWRESGPRPPIAQVARQLGVRPEALRTWIGQEEADRGERSDRPATEMTEENRRLRRENAELRRVNEVLRAASARFAAGPGPARPGGGHEVHR